MRKLIPILTGAALLMAAPTAFATTETASSGSVTAKFSYTKKSDFQYTDLRLQIARGGAIVFDKLTPPSCTEPDCGLQPALLEKGPSVSVVDLDGDGEPEVIVEVFSGGAHCCVFAEIYSYSPSSNGYANFERNFAGGYTLADVNGDRLPEFEATDSRFDEAFTAHAASTEPLMILDWRGGKLVDVTRSYPFLSRQDASFQLRLYRHERRRRDFDVRGILASYAADEYLLGKSATANRLLSKALHRGELSRPHNTGFASGRNYVRRLKKLLKKYGYAS